MRPISPVLGLALLGAGTCSPAAEYAALLSEEDFLGEVPIVLSATRLTQLLRDVPVAMTVIDRETIRLSGAQDIPDLLRLVPGFQIGRVSGHKTTAAYHGFSDRFARNMQVTIDGRSVYDAGFGGVVWADLPLSLDDIERIEVIRGPATSTYGANAFLGTINIITRHPAEQQGFGGRAALGSADTLDTDLRFGGRGGRLDYRVTGGYERSDGLEGQFDSYDTRWISARGDFQIDPSHSLQIQLGASAGPREEEDPPHRGDVYQPRHTADNRHNFQQLRWEWIPDLDNEFSLQLYRNYQQIDETFQTILFSEFLGVSPAQVPNLTESSPGAGDGWPDQRLTLAYGLESQRIDLELQHIRRLTPETRIVWGLGARRDEAHNPRFFSSATPSLSHLRAFGNLEWRPTASLSLNAGMMLEGYEGYEPEWSPRVAANIHLSPDHTLRVAGARAVRMPTLVENHALVAARFEDGSIFDVIDVGPGRLQPEEIRSLELGYTGQLLNGTAQLDVQLFRHRVRSPIGIPIDDSPGVCYEGAICTNPFHQAAGLGDAFVYANQGHLDTEGLELAASVRPLDHALLRVAYSRVDARGVFFRDLAATDRRDAGELIPSDTWSLLAGYHLRNGWTLSGAFYAVSNMTWRAEGDRMPSWERLDLRLAKTLKGNKGHGELALVLQEIGSEHNDFYLQQEIGRRVFLELFWQLD